MDANGGDDRDGEDEAPGERAATASEDGPAEQDPREAAADTGGRPGHHRLGEPAEDGPDPGSPHEPGRGDEEETVARRAVTVLVAVGLTALGLVASAVGGVPGLLIGTDTPAGFVVGLLGGELGFVLVALLFLLATGRGLGYLDLEWPDSTGEWTLVVGFTLTVFVLRTVVLIASLQLGVEPAPSTIGEVDLPPAVLTVILVPAMLLVVGPAEELLFRGVVQKFLRESFGAWPAILGAGALFGAIHLLALVQSSGLGTLLTLIVITAVGVGLGWLYERTGSLPAAMLAHGGYNALIVVTAFGLQSL